MPQPPALSLRLSNQIKRPTFLRLDFHHDMSFWNPLPNHPTPPFELTKILLHKPHPQTPNLTHLLRPRISNHDHFSPRPSPPTLSHQTSPLQSCSPQPKLQAKPHSLLLQPRYLKSFVLSTQHPLSLPKPPTYIHTPRPRSNIYQLLDRKTSRPFPPANKLIPPFSCGAEIQHQVEKKGKNILQKPERTDLV